VDFLGLAHTVDSYRSFVLKIAPADTGRDEYDVQPNGDQARDDGGDQSDSPPTRPRPSSGISTIAIVEGWFSILILGHHSTPQTIAAE